MVDRGWFVAAKSTYWPLCYGALDRLEESCASVGTSKKDELSLSLEQNVAWLDLAASAAMTDGNAGIESFAERFAAFAEAIRTGKDVPSDDLINRCITVGEICMAKSHLLRADELDQQDVPARSNSKKPKSKVKSAIVLAAEKEIKQEQLEAVLAQYRYDAIQSLRHRMVAQTYLKEAANSGHFSLSESMSEALPEVSELEKTDDITGDSNGNIRPKVKQMKEVTEREWTSLRAKADGIE
ncbi:hypothetical protein CA13_42890 [Planctomycetes bacterium CA13]|uniref:Uncharacterized protein n=1 Tax=Novipirellula herctigrandis TaxID=2527986 RepID=A0A5C5Z6Z4_9BACT|nr:hypothetical protein CA13_42890 [Planctomycetes bacterium CA13]